jgi:hypothetical protein
MREYNKMAQTITSLKSYTSSAANPAKYAKKIIKADKN